jgi:subtilisin
MILCGIDWVTATRTDADPGNDIAVANMSLGGQLKNADDGACGRTNHDAIHLAICNSVAAGVTYVTSAGNDTKDIRDFLPAGYSEVLTATAMADFDGQPGGLFGPMCQSNVDDTAATFSNFATLDRDKAHTVAAPGTCIISTYATNIEPPYQYARSSGTSFAAPHVAGMVALCIYSGACAGLTPAQIIQKIVSDAASYNTARGNSGYGFAGDPLRPGTLGYDGYLINAGLY